MHKRTLRLVCTTVSAILIAGGWATVVLCGSIWKSRVSLDTAIMVSGNEYGWKVFDVFSTEDAVVSFIVSNGTIKSCYPLPDGLFEKWREGQYEPSWTVANQAVYGINRTQDLPPAFRGGAVHLFVSIFKNEDPVEKEVHLQVTVSWRETNETAWTLGIMFMATGAAALVAFVLEMLKQQVVIRKNQQFIFRLKAVIL